LRPGRRRYWHWKLKQTPLQQMFWFPCEQTPPVWWQAWQVPLWQVKPERQLLLSPQLAGGQLVVAVPLHS
jgi:hypothetical protein